jgi:hypothetical protein
VGKRVAATIVGTLIGAAAVLLGLLVRVMRTAGSAETQTSVLRLFGVKLCLHFEKS